MMLLFWFAYLTNDVVGVLMCIEEVQDNPTLSVRSCLNLMLPPFQDLAVAEPFFYLKPNSLPKGSPFFAANKETQGC